MRGKLNQAGFTLVELLAAMAIIAAIVSMVYGSYRATCESMRTQQSRIELCRQVRTALTTIARQIRCCWAPTPTDPLQTSPEIISNTTADRHTTTQKKIPEYFSAGFDSRSGQFLSMVTTAKAVSEADNPYGLFEVRYKFDRTTRTLYESRCVFAGTVEDRPKQVNWRSVAEAVRGFEVTIFDGRRWVNSFSFREQKKLPCAVRVEITCENGRERLRTFAVTSRPACRQPDDNTAQAAPLVSVER